MPLADPTSLAHHVALCPVPCPDACGFLIAPAQIQVHKPRCPAVWVACPAHGCQWNGRRDEAAVHAATCRLLPLRPVFDLLFHDLQGLRAEVQRLQDRVGQLERGWVVGI